ncbi:hypothetical protein BGZ96_003810 [Linnemannia gamsii]|uniref:Survival Motor Neuron Gemin2-binding domain-containing protein n=1 Tax=Linnemannia gamsii TaxID=64522 RepID=A0ABQ7K824_9FUNG|nr:hypothetical protein BGZ96_003810 [Linnemannia gamsii]
MAEEFEEEYYDDEEGEDYNEEEHDTEYGYNENGGEDGDIQVGEEIDLTHEEVWDDSALIEAWDMAVKQYEVYHSKTKPIVNPKDNPKDKIAKSLTSSSSIKHKHTDSAPQSSTSSTKRTKLTHTNGTSTVSQLTRSEPDSTPTPTAAQTQQQPSQGTNSQYDVSERKPSFKKADKPSFNHHEERREEFEKEKAQKAKESSSNAKTVATSSSTSYVPPVPTVDAATIAYYRQLGYYYDPSYAGADGPEAAWQGEEHRQDGDEGGDQSQSQEQQDQLRHQQEHGHDVSGNNVKAAGNSKVSGSAHTSHGSGTLSSKTKHASTSATSRAGHKNRAAYPIPNPYVPGATMHPSPLYSSLHGFYPGYYPGHLPPAPPSHILPGVPTAAAGPEGGGGFGFSVPPGMPGIPGMPGMAPLGWNGPSGSTSFRHGAAAAAGRGMMPPPPFPPHSGGGGAFSGSKMDDEALGNLIMAWYFSGYYTGLYQAQRR